jgi:hypothetical protein
MNTSDRFEEQMDAAQARSLQLDPHRISAEDLGRLGVSQIAYVKSVVVNGATAFAIFAADGTPMAVAGDQAVAIGAIRQHDMEPALVH